MEQCRAYFFIGTEAELIKLFPVMLALRQLDVPFKIIASGQNDIIKSDVLKAVNGGRADLILSDESEINKSASGLLRWFLNTWQAGKKAIPNTFGAQNLKGSLMIVHGDTVSTLMGAQLAARLGMRVAHVEAGLRSHNWLNPFPEEIDRVLTSLRSNYNFAPGAAACKNLSRARGETIDTVYNTIIDSLAFSKAIPCANDAINTLLERPFFVFVLHRQENLANKALLTEAVRVMHEMAKQMTCAMILHKPTEIALEKLGLLQGIKEGRGIVALPRAEYFDFMKLLQAARFVITDGGSNQEELSYMGKPCLIMRTHTERQDGIGDNAVLYNGDLRAIGEFAQHYEDYLREPVACAASPARVIAEKIKCITQQV